MHTPSPCGGLPDPPTPATSENSGPVVRAAHRRCYSPSASLPRRRRQRLTLSRAQNSEVRGRSPPHLLREVQPQGQGVAPPPPECYPPAVPSVVPPEPRLKPRRTRRAAHATDARQWPTQDQTCLSATKIAAGGAGFIGHRIRQRYAPWLTLCCSMQPLGYDAGRIGQCNGNKRKVLEPPPSPRCIFLPKDDAIGPAAQPSFT